MSYESLYPGFEGAQSVAYRILYVRPSEYSDEQIAIGLVASGGRHLEARFISSLASLELLSRVFGEDGVEQVQFAAAEIRRAVTRIADLDTFMVPTNMVSIGPATFATTSDRNGLLIYALDAASCLSRAQSHRAREVTPPQTAGRLARDLWDTVSRIDPLLANEIFGQTHRLPSGEVLELPILGRRIFGAPVSFAGRTAGLSDHKVRAEAMVARFQVYRKHLPQQQPKLYLLAPAGPINGGRSVVENHVNELRDVAAASRVALTISESTEQLALSLINDEVRAA